MTTKQKTFAVYIILAAASFSAGLAVNASYRRQVPLHTEGDGHEHCEYKLINPLRCDSALISPRKEFIALRQKLEDFINQEKKAAKVNTVGIYFRDLHDGPIVNINEMEKFSPASLLKVPIMITYLKLAEEDPQLLQKKIGKDFVPLDTEVNTSGDQTIYPQTEYAIEELLYKMIAYSDNRSKDLLVSYLSKLDKDYDPFFKTISDLGIIADNGTNEDFLSVKSYASIFRTLYNASYLNNQMSEKALGMLAGADFNDGIVAPLPEDVKVAHKFGDRLKKDGELQRHDCGVVYLENGNYILCVMTRGKNLEDLNFFIQSVSAIIYNEVKTTSRN